jgi:heavy metal sensor kinase
VLAQHQSLAHLDAALREELQELSLEVQLAHAMPELRAQLDTRFYQHDVYDFRVLDETGRAIFVSPGLTTLVEAMPPPDVVGPVQHVKTAPLGSAGDVRIASMSARGPLGKFSVEALTSLAPYYAELQSLRAIMLVVLPLTLAIASLGGYWLAGRALDPVKQIVRVADAITIDHLDRRIEVTNPHDEIGCLAATLNSLIARLECSVNEIQRFTADASHELRTPLAALRSEAESALRSRRSPEEYEETLTIIVAEATRLGRLADQLLNLSRHDAGIISYEHESVRLDALLLDVADQLRPLADQRNVTMDCGDAPPCEMQGDDIRLGQAFFNILENAVKYTPADGRITVRCRVDNGAAVIEVEDTGVGIAAEHLPHVFDRFYRVDPSRNCIAGGTGLGLAIARAAVVAHGGKIDIRSQPQVGTTVTIRFPAAVPVEDEPCRMPALVANSA